MKEFMTKAPLDNFAASERFLRQNQSILSRAANQQDFRSAAIDALSAAREIDRPEQLREIAKLCLEKCVILSKCAADDPNSGDWFINRLSRGHKGTVNSFREQLRNLEANCEHVARTRQPQSGSAQNRSERPSDPRVASLTQNMENTSLSPSGYANPQGGHQTALPPKVPQNDPPNNRHGKPATVVSGGVGAENLPARNLSTDGVIFSADTTIKDPRFQPLDKKRWDTFFVLGRVFAIMTFNEDSRVEGDNDDLSVQSVRIGGRTVQAKVRRLVVVETEHGFCWAIPILTYGNQGLAKPGLRPADVAAHARIHMEGSPAQWRPTDPWKLVEKKDVAVRGPPGSRLHPYSRVNFEKPYTVEYNVKVMNIGRVTETSMGFFVGNWKEVLRQKASRSHRS